MSSVTADRVRDAVEHHLHGAVQVAGDPPADWMLTDRMARYHVPGVAVALILDGSIAWSAGYGIVGPDGAPVAASTRFQVASISKVVAACTALALVDAGHLTLDDDVNDVLVRWKVPHNRFTSDVPVTLRRLLDHSAGVSVSAFDGYPPEADLPDLVDILAGRPPSRSPAVDVVAAPGTTYRYSGGGFCIVELLIEDVTGQRFADVARQLVLEPAGMNASGFVADAGDAAGHDDTGHPMLGGHVVHPELAAAGLWSTADDVAALVVAIQRSRRGDGPILTATSAGQLVTPTGPGRRGLGVDLLGRGASARFRHGGSNCGFTSRVEGFVGLPDGLVVLTNGDGGHALISEIVGTVGPVAKWPGVAPLLAPRPGPSGAPECAGSYTGEDGKTVSLVAEGVALRAPAPYGSRRVLPLGWRHFVDEDTAAEAIFDHDTRPNGFDLVVDGRIVSRFHRVITETEVRG